MSPTDRETLAALEPFSRGVKNMATPGIKTIVVGLDGSAESAAALHWAARMARGMGSKVVAVYAIHVPLWLAGAFEAPVPPLQYDAGWRAAVKKEFEEEWCRPLEAAGIKYRTVIEDGRPALVIADVADQVDADVIVVGRRGRGGVAELVLGSVSHELVLQSRRPVLLIPHAKAAGA
jgi:nucleotide-binding universal stress UspA family protein